VYFSVIKPLQSAELWPSYVVYVSNVCQDNDWGISSYPLIPGHEVVGIVEAKGANVEGLEVGQR